MNTHVAIGESRGFELAHALLVYADHVGGGAYVTVHEVRPRKKGAPTLGPGRPADLAFLRALSEGLQTAVPPEVLPEHVLSRTPDQIVWWSAAAVRPMYFRDNTSLGGVSGQMFPQPALVWKIEGRSLFVRALRVSRRPDAKTRLYVAPYWNTDMSGRVCLGSMKRPSRIGVDTLREWETGYFGSLFTGQNGTGVMIKGKGGVVGLWKRLAGKTRFPHTQLVDAKETLADFIGGGRHGRA